MKVLIADKLDSTVARRLTEMGCSVDSEPSLKGSALSDALGRLQPEVLVVRSTKVQKEQLLECGSLALIIRAGAGVNTIDVAQASSQGIFIANCPGKNAIAVAELAMGHLINLDRRISDNAADLRKGLWRKKHYSKARGLYSRTLAVLGAGSTGREMILRARAFGMAVRVWEPMGLLGAAQAEELGIEFAETPLDACRDADAVSVHLALTPETRGIVGRAELAALRDGAFVVNTARGGIVDEAALLDAISEKGLRAGLDVFDNEPGANAERFESPTAQSSGVYGTHHIGASTEQASEAVGEAVVESVRSWMQDGRVDNCVNIAKQTPADHLLTVRHADRVGVLAGVLGKLRQGQHNVQEMENIIFQGGEAGCARIQIVGRPSEALVEELQVDSAVYAISIKRMD
jgi:D-3-phosphoglycerate dehydrogenase / 2-oxoglutarate reductase